MNTFERSVFRINAEKLRRPYQDFPEVPSRSPVHLTANSYSPSSTTSTSSNSSKSKGTRGTYGDYLREARREHSRQRNRRASSVTIDSRKKEEEDPEVIAARRSWGEGSKLEVFHSQDYKWYRASVKRVIFDGFGEWLEVEFLNDVGIMRRRQIPRKSAYLRPIYDYTLPKMTYTHSDQDLGEEPCIPDAPDDFRIWMRSNVEKLDSQSKDQQANLAPTLTLQITVPEPIPNAAESMHPDEMINENSNGTPDENHRISPGNLSSRELLASLDSDGVKMKSAPTTPMNVNHTISESFEENIRKLQENVDPQLKSLLENSMKMDDHIGQLLVRSNSMSFINPEDPANMDAADLETDLGTPPMEPGFHDMEPFTLLAFLNDDEPKGGEDGMKISDKSDLPALTEFSDMRIRKLRSSIDDPLHGHFVDIDTVSPENNKAFTSLMDQMFPSSTKREEIKAEQASNGGGHEKKSSYGILWDTFAPPPVSPERKPLFPPEIVSVVKSEITLSTPEANIPNRIVEKIEDEFNEEMNYLKERNHELENEITDLRMENEEMADVLEYHVDVLDRVGRDPEEIVNLNEQIRKLQEKLKEYEIENERLQKLEEKNSALTLENRTLKIRLTRLFDSKHGESSEDDAHGESLDYTDGDSYTRRPTMESVASDDFFAFANTSRTDEFGKEIPLGPELLLEICRRHDPISAGSLTEEQFRAAFGEIAQYSKGLSINSALHLFHELNDNGRVKYDHDLYMLIQSS